MIQLVLHTRQGLPHSVDRQPLGRDPAVMGLQLLHLLPGRLPRSRGVVLDRLDVRRAPEHDITPSDHQFTPEELAMFWNATVLASSVATNCAMVSPTLDE